METVLDQESTVLEYLDYLSTTLSTNIREHLILLKGMHHRYNKNEEYDTGKAPVNQEKNRPVGSYKDKEILMHVEQKGWLGLKIPQGIVVVDLDYKHQSNSEVIPMFIEGLKYEGIAFTHIKTPNGHQLLFRENEKIPVKNTSEVYTMSGLIADYRTSGKGYIVLPYEVVTPNRKFVEINQQLEVMPHLLTPVNSIKKGKGLEHERTLHLPLYDGGRNTIMFEYGSFLVEVGHDKLQIAEVIKFIANYSCVPSYDLDEINATIESLLEYTPSGRAYFNQSVDQVKQKPKKIDLPTLTDSPFHIPSGYEASKHLYMYDKEGFPHVICNSPFVLSKRMKDIISGFTHLELTWINEGESHSITRLQGDLMTRKNLLELANFGFPVNEINAKMLISYMDKFLLENGSTIPTSKVTSKLGFIKGKFILPTKVIGTDEEISFKANEGGDIQFVESIRSQGTVEDWINHVFSKVKNYPKPLALLLSSLASPIIKDFNINPFIVDLSGSTGQGKTVAEEVAASVWGNPQGYVMSWNATRVAIERRSALLNSLPLFLDDTKKANNVKEIQNIIYQFSNGRGKMRGQLKGSQIDETWHNIMLSSGEAPITKFSNSGGVAGRVLPLNDRPFGESKDVSFFSDLSSAYTQYFGSIGVNFIEWYINLSKDDFESYRQLYVEYCKALTKGTDQETIKRIARYMAILFVVANMLKQGFKIDIDLSLLDNLWQEIINTNQEADIPKKALIGVIDHLEANEHKLHKHNEKEPYGETIGYTFKDGALGIKKEAVKDYLERKGYDVSTIIKEWEKRNLTINKVEKHNGKSRRMFKISPEIVLSQGVSIQRDNSPF
ncbi:DUF927 domain-containing protein [Gottfriedia acidiceleris]|uniref:DUF927 domain-containing protein n=1 Tax=Gottfriedia acidiceleris TaxID=371036 RepID=UPI002FFDBAF7